MAYGQYMLPAICCILGGLWVYLIYDALKTGRATFWFGIASAPDDRTKTPFNYWFAVGCRVVFLAMAVYGFERTIMYPAYSMHLWQHICRC
jgi:hypothetical protein